MDLLLSFSERWSARYMFLHVLVVDKAGYQGSTSSVTQMSDIVAAKVIAEGASSSQHGSTVNVCESVVVMPAVDPSVEGPPVQVEDIPNIDWSKLDIVNVPDGPGMEEDQMYVLLGLRAEDERVENAKATTNANHVPNPIILDDELASAAIPVNDDIPGEPIVHYDREDPPMSVNTVYPSMDEFRMAVRQHAIKGEFELGTEKSCKSIFRGYCTSEGCPWAIVARLNPDNKTVRVTLNKFGHKCASIGRVKTKVASQKWIAEKVGPSLRKHPDLGAMALKEELEGKYNITLNYSTVWAGRQRAVDHIFGSWEESFHELYRFKAEVEKRSPGSVVEIDVKQVEDKVYFNRYFCAFKSCIDGFLNGCRPYLSIDSTALNGRWNGHLASATALNGHNWMFPVAFGFFDAETTDNWTWFIEQLHKSVGDLPHLAISSDACKGLEIAVKKVYPWAEHREYFRHLMQNFVKKFQGPVYGNMFPAARAYRTEVFEHYMNKIHEADPSVQPWLFKWHKLLWMRCVFSDQIKCDYINNNLAESWNAWIKDMKDLPITELVDVLRARIMQLFDRRRRIGERLQGVMLPVVVEQMNAQTRGLGNLKVICGAKDTAEVTEINPDHQVFRHAVNLKNHECTCREWQVSGKPCTHALAFISTYRNHKMEDYLDPCYSVTKFRIAYAGVIAPLTDKSQWPQVDVGFMLMPPLQRRYVGRQKKNRIPSCLEKGKIKGKGKWKVLCKRCGELGHRQSSYKCKLNGTKKRKRRSRKKVDRPSKEAEASTSTPKRQKVTM
ncbi:uncharacterized protein LOC133898658 [Phragmites australis]|uniref:uncharacterized protein LOC133898658 n=1 Tax=Phragmites australis TaxID=29695 RepID=UPI002D787C05|nr:uncharacterized protein LOC133898658 [Phragmites australis]